jgi:hypothetical protein
VSCCRLAVARGSRGRSDLTGFDQPHELFRQLRLSRATGARPRSIRDVSCKQASLRIPAQLSRQLVSGGDSQPVHIGCFIDDHPDIGKGLDIARAHGEAIRDGNTLRPGRRPTR